MAEAPPVLRGPWPGGINNRANEFALPAGTVRDALNVDPGPNGVFMMRAGYTKQVSGSALRGILSVQSYVLMADGATLRLFDAQTDSTSSLKAIASYGRFAGAVFNQELFFCTEDECLRFQGGILRTWGVPFVSSQPVPAITDGGLLAGEYQCSVTFVDAHGDEGGTTLPIVVTVPSNAGLSFTLPTPPDGGKVRLYIAPAQGSELYLQFEGVGNFLCSTVNTDTQRLETEGLRAPVPGDYICEAGGVICIADGKTLWLTEPLRPHLRNQARRFFQYPAQIDGIVAADNGLFVLADKTYFVSGIETDEPQQLDILPYGGVRGSMVKTVDNFAAWMTGYGLAKSDGLGKAALISAANFLPGLASHGSSGIIERNGSQLVVTTMRSASEVNPLRANDYSEAEIEIL
jgi:hypothetical protein